MMKSLISVLHDPFWVWRFQSFFGVEKVKVSEIDPKKDWDNVEIERDSKKLIVTDKELEILQKRDRNLILYKVFIK